MLANFLHVLILAVSFVMNYYEVRTVGQTKHANHSRQTVTLKSCEWHFLYLSFFLTLSFMTQFHEEMSSSLQP